MKGACSLANGSGMSESCKTISITWRGREQSGEQIPGEAIFETARRFGMSPRFSCLAGECSACMARVTQGSATMRVDEGLTEGEIAAGYVLTCQAFPAADHVAVAFDE